MSVPKKKEPPELPFRYGSSVAVGSPSTSSDSIKNLQSGQSIEDFQPVEFKEKFAPKMVAKYKLSESFKRLGTGSSKVFNEFSDGFEPVNLDLNRFGFTKRAERVLNCGTSLVLSYGIYETGELDTDGRLVFANFCKDRLCPMCNWRRSLKIYGQVSKIMDVISKDYAFVFLTLTVPNCKDFELSETLDNMNQGFYRLKRLKRFKKAVKGFHRATEVTVNKKNGTYHPHFHVILAVDSNYFKSKDYINHSEWLQMWRDTYNDQSITQVDIRKIKPDESKNQTYQDAIKKSVCEVSKYSVKASDFLGKFDDDGNLVKPFPDEIIDSRVFTLANALKQRQLSVFGGIFFDTLKRLNLDDAENGDLIHVSDDKLNPYIAELLIRFSWSVGIGKYERIDSQIKMKGADLVV